MSDVDPYETLGVSREATDAEIKDAYRKKARESHPDSGDTEEWDDVKDAYEILISPKKRWRHDNGHDNEQQRDSAADMLLATFQQLTEQNHKRDLGEALRNALKSQKAATKMQRKELVDDCKKKEGLVDRISIRGEKRAGLIHALISEQIRTAKAKLEGLDEIIIDLETAIEMAGDVEDSFEPEALEDFIVEDWQRHTTGTVKGWGEFG